MTTRPHGGGRPHGGRRGSMRRQCSATSKRSGQRCRRAPIVGGTVCVTHGGGAPQVKLAARERIAALVDPAIDALQRALRHRDIGVAVRAARDLLDRAGFVAPKPIEPTERRVTLEELVAGANRPEIAELVRLEDMPLAAVVDECEARHSGRCQSLIEHANANAAERRTDEGRSTPHIWSGGADVCTSSSQRTADGAAPGPEPPLQAPTLDGGDPGPGDAGVLDGTPVGRSRRPAYPYCMPRRGS